MIVSFSKRFIFIKTRKTAGTSMEIALSGQCADGDIVTPIVPEDELLRFRQGGFLAVARTKGSPHGPLPGG